MSTPAVGNFALTGTKNLPNVTVAFPGEHWSDRKATELIVPGEAVVPVKISGSTPGGHTPGNKLGMRRAASAAEAKGLQAAIALRTVQVPDVNVGPGSLGPNEIMDQAIQIGEYVHAYYSGAFHLTLITPDTTWGAADLVEWDPAGARPAGVGGTGSWKKASAATNAVFEVQEWRPVGTAGEGILTVRSLRSQF
jgi:hypothetical protein